MAFTRRNILVGASLLPVLSLLAQETKLSAVDALSKARLIYLTPLKTDGSESKCHGEVWFAFDGTEIYVNTQMDAWRANAIRKGLTSSRIWVGEYGVWTSSDGAYKNAPSLEVSGKLETDAAEWDRVLPLFGAKYTKEWSSWGPRFKNGLEDGSRVLLRYSIKT